MCAGTSPSHSTNAVVEHQDNIRLNELKTIDSLDINLMDKDQIALILSDDFDSSETDTNVVATFENDCKEVELD